MSVMGNETSTEVSISDLRENTADIINAVSARGQIAWVTNRGRRVAALVPLAVAERGQPADEPAGEQPA